MISADGVELMGKPNAIKIISVVSVAFQAVSILVSAANLIYCFITASTDLFIFSNVAFFIPQYYITYGLGFWNIIPLAIFISITVFLFYKSSLILLNIKKAKNYYAALNLLWLMLCNASYLMFFAFNTATLSYVPYLSFANIYIWILFIYLYMFAMLKKSQFMKKIDLKNSVKTYADVKKYSYANSFIALFTVLLAFWMHYFSDMPLSNPNGTDMSFLDFMLYPVFWAINIVLFVMNILSYYNLKKAGKTMPAKHFILKMNMYQIFSFVVSVVSFYLTAYVLF